MLLKDRKLFIVLLILILMPSLTITGHLQTINPEDYGANYNAKVGDKAQSEQLRQSKF